MKFSKTQRLVNEKKTQPEKYRTNIYVTKEIYETFQSVCVQRGLTVTQVFDSMMEDFVREYSQVVPISQAQKLSDKE